MSLDTAVPADTLSQSLQPAAVEVSRLGEEYRPLLQLVRLVIGVVPNCDSLLAIWPTGFRSYNLLCRISSIYRSRSGVGGRRWCLSGWPSTPQAGRRAALIAPLILAPSLCAAARRAIRS